MSDRGRRASLPPADHARPEPLSSDGLVVHHYNAEGQARRYDFSMLPVAEPMQRSLAALFGDRCASGRWTAHPSSQNCWFALVTFTTFVAAQPRPPRDLDQLTVALVKRWRESTFRSGGYRVVAGAVSLLARDPRLRAGPVADELARRMRRPESKVQSYSEADFDRIKTAARRMFRAALLRIEDNARHLERWRSGQIAESSQDWLIGEGLDILVRTGDLPGTFDKNNHKNVLRKYLTALGGTRAEGSWQRLFLSRTEAVALGVLLLAEYGWNLSVIDRLEVPRASPDPGEDGHPTYRIPLEKRRRGGGHHYEIRNVTDSGAGSPGRLITQALAATRFARALVEQWAPGTNRLIVWRVRQPNRASKMRRRPDRHPLVGPFDFGVSGDSAHKWAQAIGIGGSPFQRGRRTVVALDRREPTQHSQDTHDRTYALVDPQVQAGSVEVIAAGAEDAAGRARHAVLVAELRNQPSPEDVETATVDCGDFDNSPWPAPEGGCSASFLMCLACSNAHIHPGHHPRLAHLHEALANLRSVLPPTAWQADWGHAHDRLDDLKAKLGDGQWAQALARVTTADRDLIDQLLTGALDT